MVTGLAKPVYTVRTVYIPGAWLSNGFRPDGADFLPSPFGFNIPDSPSIIFD
jgi:hypothetical protein